MSLPIFLMQMNMMQMTLHHHQQQEEEYEKRKESVLNEEILSETTKEDNIIDDNCPITIDGHNDIYSSFDEMDIYHKYGLL